MREEISWRDEMPVAEVRFARPTDRLDDVVRFYRDGIGLQIIDQFGGEGHHGYTGVILGLPGRRYHLEFTQHDEGSPCPAPTRDNLLVLYLPQRDSILPIVDRLRTLGHEPVEPENPYWAAPRGWTFEDPDGWRVVLMNTEGI